MSSESKANGEASAATGGPTAGFRRDQGGESEMANIGKSISIKGDVIGDEDTVIEGRVEGRIELKNHHLTVGPNGNVSGEISAKQVTVVGAVAGNIKATERIELRESGQVEGDLYTPRLLVQEGAQLNGAISMDGAPVAKVAPTKAEEAPKAIPLSAS